MNKDLGAIVYIFGLVITMINNYLINSGTVIENKSPDLKSEFCYIGIPFIPKFNMRSSPNMAVITYTFFFFLMPTFIRNLHYMKNPLALMEYMFDKNKFLFLFFGLTMVFNRYSEKYFGCSNPAMNGLDISNGFFVGMFSAWLMLLIFYVTGHKNLLLTSRFLDNKILCVIPNNKVFKCSNDNNISAIAFSSQPFPSSYDEKFYYGDRDLSRIDGMKIAGVWTNVHIYGNTDVVVYKYPDFKGDKILIKHRDMKQKTKIDSRSSQKLNDQGNAPNSLIVYKWENNYITAIKTYNKKIYELTQLHHPEKTERDNTLSIVLETPDVGRIIPPSGDWKYNDNGTDVDISFNLVSPTPATAIQDGITNNLVNYDGTTEKPIQITVGNKTYDNISNNFKDLYTIVEAGSDFTKAKIEYLHNISIYDSNNGSIYPIGDNTALRGNPGPIPPDYFKEREINTNTQPLSDTNVDETIGINILKPGKDYTFNSTSTPEKPVLDYTWKLESDNKLANGKPVWKDKSHISIIGIREDKEEFIERNKEILYAYQDYKSIIYDGGTVEGTTPTEEEKLIVIKKMEKLVQDVMGSSFLDDFNEEINNKNYVTLTREEVIDKCIWNKQRCSEEPLLSSEASSTETIGSIQLIKSKD